MNTLDRMKKSTERLDKAIERIKDLKEKRNSQIAKFATISALFNRKRRNNALAITELEDWEDTLIRIDSSLSSLEGFIIDYQVDIDMITPVIEHMTGKERKKYKDIKLSLYFEHEEVSALRDDLETTRESIHSMKISLIEEFEE